MESKDFTQQLIGFAAILEAMERQRAALDEAIAKMRIVAGAATSPVASNGFGAGGQASIGMIAPGEVPPGAFHGKSIPEASTLYLRMVKQKQKAAEIAGALRRGGIESRAGNFNTQVHSLLDRASKKDGSELIKMHDAYWALREWFPANVRSSMASVAAPGRTKAARKRTGPRGHRRSKGGQSPANSSPPAKNSSDEMVSYSDTQPETLEGKLLAAMRTVLAKEWKAAEIAAAAGIPRVQTAILLLNRLAKRELIRKSEAGTFQIQ